MIDKPVQCVVVDGVRRSAVAIEFDRGEYWRKPQVVCLVASRVPTGLAALVTQLQAELAAEGLAIEARPFRPHVTLARKVRSAAGTRLEPPFLWQTKGFALVRSVTDPAGSRYEPLDWWNPTVEGD